MISGSVCVRLVCVCIFAVLDAGVVSIAIIIGVVIAAAVDVDVDVVGGVDIFWKFVDCCELVVAIIGLCAWCTISK